MAPKRRLIWGTLAGAYLCAVGGELEALAISSPKKKQQSLTASFALHTGAQQSAPDSLQQPCAPARVHKDETAWTVALHLSPWGAAQQIPRESRQDARTGVLWGRRAKRRQPSRPPVNRARHSQVPTDAARPKNTSAAEQK